MIKRGSGEGGLASRNYLKALTEQRGLRVLLAKMVIFGPPDREDKQKWILMGICGHVGEKEWRDCSSRMVVAPQV